MVAGVYKIVGGEEASDVFWWGLEYDDRLSFELGEEHEPFFGDAGGLPALGEAVDVCAG